MKFKLFGATGFTCQLPRIREGLLILGHEEVNENPDFIYSNDFGGHEEAIAERNRIGGKLILNTLDIPLHVWMTANFERAKEILRQADIRTCISHTVKDDIKRYLNLDSSVIYNPIKDVSLDPSIKKDCGYLAIGRVNDVNKRFYLIRESLQILNQQQYLTVAGNENPGYGNWLGVVDDTVLNRLYNRHKYCFITSLREGICLPMIESIICGGIPIVCEDMTTAKEFFLENYLVTPDPGAIVQKIGFFQSNYTKVQKDLEPLREKYKLMFDKKSVANNIVNLLTNSEKPL